MRRQSAGRRAVPLLALAAVATLFAAVVPMRAAFGTSEIPAKSARPPTAATQVPARLPAPGSYELLRITRLPDTALLNASAFEEPLRASTRGTITLLSFFYASCRDPEGCPVIWTAFEEVRANVMRDTALAGKVRFVFVSLDPSRDGPQIMGLFEKSYADGGTKAPWRFLTAHSDTTLAPLLAAAGQDIAVEPDPNDPNGRVINHMVKVFLIDPDGWVREIYTSAFLKTPTVMNDIRTLAMQVTVTGAATRTSTLGRFLSWLGF